MLKLSLFVLLGLACVTSAADRALHTFKKVRVTDQFWAEGAHYGDFNKDGQGDVVAGPYWWEGPEFKVRHEYAPATKSFKTKQADGTEIEIPGFEGALGKNNAYSDNFFAFTDDINKDGWVDILIYGFPGLDASWYENPKGRAGHWTRHKVFGVVDNESPAWVDLTGDKRKEILCNSGGFFGYAEPNWNQPADQWTWHPISSKGNWQRFTHGLGYGDVNGDGRPDILEAGGWWEQPASLAGDPQWQLHPQKFGSGGAQMYAYDVNGDGLNDVITSLAAHGYGLVWFEQVKQEGKISFKQRDIVGKTAEENPYGVVFSQPHAIDLADIDKDGLMDIVTGKRFWAHGPQGDAEPGAPAVLYWFKLVRGKDGQVEFIPYLIDDDSGIGTQVVAGDVNGDGWLDVVVGNKKGVFVHLHQVKQVSEEEWRKEQPVRKPGPTAAMPAGELPKGADGRALNLDFETGTLKDWTAEGEAFAGLPIEGDTVNKRRSNMHSRHAGRFWIGTFEAKGDPAHGELTSAPFKVTHPFAAFLIGGGPYERTRVELVQGEKVIFKVSGYDADEFRKSNDASETMRHVVVDLQPHQGKTIFVRVVDRQDGHWGHINFDDFKFYTSRPEFKDEVASGRKALVDQTPSADVVKFAGLPPGEAVKAMTLPAGFSARLFAGEPDLRQPIAFALDDRGRVWVVEAFSYPRRQPEGQGKDRILIFEDADGDGGFDRRTVFQEGLNLVSGLEVGFGGVWVGAAPHLLFIPDRNGDDKPDGAPEVILDGWAWQDTHETLNTFTWGPDGWLYGCHGVFTHSKVGKPGTPEMERVPLNAGVWRYHPTDKRFEVFGEGTSNPWGIDFDEQGQCFIEACVIPHLFHVIQGARYQRQAGRHFSPYVYDDIKTIGDHVHYAGDKGPHAGNNRSDQAGGGHAHAGLLIYQGGSWPKEYHGKIFMNNIHGQRINMDIPERAGSGFVGRHGPDFVNFNDRWSQVINLLTDQDGSLLMIDWYDANQCHHNRLDGHDQSNGRIYKVVHNNHAGTPVDLQKKSSAQLVQLQLHPNEWHVRHARRILQERGPDPAVHQALGKILAENQAVSRRLRALWALHMTDGLDPKRALALLEDSEEYIRAWAIQLLAENKHVSEDALTVFAKLARQDPSPVVRLYLASALQRVPPAQRLDVLKGLFAHAEDANDHNLPLMYWYAAEAVAGIDVKTAAQLLASAKLPRLREFVTRRMTASEASGQ